MTLFVDSSALYATVDAADEHHADVVRILSVGEPLLTSDHVLVETSLLVNRWLGFQTAQRTVETVKASTSLEFVGAADLEKAFAIAEAYPDQEFSLVDRTSFAVMERLGVHRAVAYDDDFAVYRFGRDRRRAFELVR